MRSGFHRIPFFGLIPDAWDCVRIDDMFDVQLGKMLSKKARTGENAKAYIGNSNVQWGRFRLNDLAKMDFSPDEQAKFRLENGDLLVCEGGEVGRSAIWQCENFECYYQKALHRLRAKSSAIDSWFFYYCMEDACRRKLFLAITSTSSIPHLTRETLVRLRFPRPSLAEQQKLASIFRAWDKANSILEQQIFAKTQLKNSLLQKVHEGDSDNWKAQKLGELFKHRKKKGTDGLPTYSVTMDNGLVLRDSLERKNDTSLRPDAHLLIEKDDIAYNMMRMWQGASGLAPASGLVSPAYVVLRSRGEVDPLFASYWFKTPRVIKKFQDYSHGLTKDRLRLYYKDFASITLPVPPIDLQRKIAKALSACDRELDLLRRKLELLKLQKKGLMQQLLTGKIRVKLPKGAK